ncbi:MAG: methionine--tRNA ligase [Bdellovibrionales bacterium]
MTTTPQPQSSAPSSFGNSTSARRRILMTIALPYANGPIHLGHMVEAIQADIWARFQKMQGHEVHFFCADDTHGTPIMIKAREQKKTPENLIEEVWKDHTQTYRNFEIDFTHYSSTNSPTNRQMCEHFYSKMLEKKAVSRRSIEQLYCEHDKMFLPDRFVKGTCPKCKSPDQYGDSCDVCGSTYSPSDMKDAGCSLCGTKPVKKMSEHVFFDLEPHRELLKSWLGEHTTDEVRKKMLEWFHEELRPWDITRDGPYFGFPIPGEKDKYFYVWVDAPMGYISSSKEYFDKKGLRLEDYWKNPNVEIHHFIGKDIVYFHTLFWPALLKTADFQTPKSVHVHGRLMINGEKMSKSKGNFVGASTYAKHLPSSYLRYYYATKLNSTLDDFDLSFDDFVSRVNSELVGKITNLASRGAQMLGKKAANKMSTCEAEGLKLVKKSQAKAREIAELFDRKEFSKAMTEIRSLADEANRFFDEKAPWKTAETDTAGTIQVLTSTLNIFRCLAIYLKPVLPSYAEKVERLFQEAPYTWADSQKTLENHTIAPFEALITRIESEKVKAIMDETQKETEQIQKEKQAAKTNPTPSPAAAKPEGASDGGYIDIEDFSKVDLRVAEVIQAEAVPEADKLLKIQVDLGELGRRQIFAGIKAAYDPKTLVGRKLLVVANLKPRKMKFGMSEGMILAAGPGAPDLFVLSPDAGAKAGDKVK